MQPRLLAKRASDLSRRIYASLPWGYRLALLFQKLASGIQDAFARAAYAEFIKQGVTDLPDIGDVPALAWREKLQRLGTRAADKLPKNYARKYGEMVWRVLLSRAHRDADLVEGVMTDVTVKLISKPSLEEGATRQEAESYVLTMCVNLLMDRLRSQGRKHEVGLGEEDEEGEFSGDVLDPDALRRFEEAIPPTKFPELLRALDKLHPSAGEYIRLRLDNVDKTEIARGGLLPHMPGPVSPQAVTNWEKVWLPKIRKVLNRYMEIDY